ncbi:MAG: hypothetical protein K0R66_1131 [Gammaproteobacteria bacterium]|jgi:hypothetical protein|nr:hypothetical protein [Gammaproteobacteria bacterium]
MFKAKDIKQEEMLELVTKVRSAILSSNHLLPRQDHPYYHSHPGVPQALQVFKEKFTNARMLASRYILEHFEKETHPMLGDFSLGKFPHNFTASLAVGSLHIGECAECSDKLAAEMILRGFGNLSIVHVTFPKASPGMERGHQFIVANLAKSPDRSFQGKSIVDFLRSLPADAVIGDPFLGLVFSPKDTPRALLKYIEAYGGEAVLAGCFHFTNLGMAFLSPFLSYADRVAKAIADKADTTISFYITEGPWKKLLEAKKTEIEAAAKP